MEYRIQGKTLKDIADSIRSVDPNIQALSPQEMDDEIRRLTAVIDQTYDGESSNPISGKAVKQAIDTLSEKPDYNQNDSTAKDYIKNRPFYTEVTETTLLDGTFDFVENNGLYMTISEDFPVFLEEGKTYTVLFDGTSYSCTGYIPVEGLPIVLGNISLVEPELTGGNNEPFLMANSSDEDSSLGIFTNLTDASHTVKIIGPEEVVKKLDAKYLPDEIYTAIDTVDSKVATAIDTVDSKVATKMDKENPTGTGSFSLNRKANTAIGDYSFAEGYHTTAFGECSHAEGESTIAGQMGFGVTACEKLTDTTGTYTLTSVAGLTRYERYSVSLSSSKKNCGKITSIDTANKKITVDGYPDIALSSSSSPTANYLTIVNKPGLGDISVSGRCSHAEGVSTTASGNYSHAEGNYTTASGYCSHAEGSSTTASGSQSHAEGDGTKASGDYSHAEGRQNTASGQFSHAEGNYTTASGSRSHTEGFYATASGEISHAEGDKTTALGDYSHAEGASTNRFSSVVTTTNPTDTDIIAAWKSKKFSVAKGSSAHVEGKDNLALADYSHAEGNNTTASGNYSHAEGHLTTASGTSSHAEGFRTAASGDDSHAEGDGTTAGGDYSHAEGYCTTASGDDSHAEGANTKASSEDQHAQGKYNIEDSTGTYADIIGNGTDDSARSNAATVDWLGNAWYAGDVYVGSTSGTNKDEGSKKLATEEYVSTALGNYIPDPSLSITGATVGQIAKITAIDSNGKPTAWEPVDMPSGGGENALRLVVDTTTTEDVAQIEFTEDMDGNPLKLKKFIFILEVPVATAAAKAATIGTYLYRWMGTMGDTIQYASYSSKDVPFGTSKTNWWGEFCLNIESDGKYAILYKRATNVPYSNNTVNSDGGTYERQYVRYSPYSSGGGIYYFHETIDGIFYKSGSTTVMIPTGTKIKIWGVDA